MKRILNLSIDKHLDAPQKWVEIAFHPEIISDWCLQLCLLETGLQDSVKISSLDKKFSIDIRVDKNVSTNDRGFVRLNDKLINLSVAPNELEMWKYFFLKYYRDGFAEVDHIDSEFILDKASEISFVLKVFEFQPPLSSEEAKKILGL